MRSQSSAHTKKNYLELIVGKLSTSDLEKAYENLVQILSDSLKELDSFLSGLKSTF